MHQHIGYIALGVRNRFSRQSGQTLTEYAVLLAFIVILVAAAISSFGKTLLDYWNNNLVLKFPGG
jgi:Flp pilus assembly pilin Flp